MRDNARTPMRSVADHQKTKNRPIRRNAAIPMTNQDGRAAVAIA
ncbi:MAG: hypothetical protein WD042_03150 [Phycisphaeraceae bacterium]